MATLQRHPDKRVHHFLQTGTVPAAPPDSGWRWDAGEAQPLPDLWILPCGICPRAPWPMPPKPSKGLSNRHNPPAWPCSAACRRGRPVYGGGRRMGARARFSPLVQGQALLHAEDMGTVE